jgi:hypothetical protein
MMNQNKKDIMELLPLPKDISNIIISMSEGKKFEVGKTYWTVFTTWDDDTDQYKVIKRTKCVITIEAVNSSLLFSKKRCKVKYDEDGNEYIKIGDHPTIYSTDKV